MIFRSQVNDEKVMRPKEIENKIKLALIDFFFLNLHLAAHIAANSIFNL